MVSVARLIVAALVCFCAVGRGQAVTFAWLSDTHVGSTTGAEDLASSVSDINRDPEIQFVLLSGDITEFGSDQQLLLAKSILDSLRKPYHILPGNHDTKWSPSGGTAFPALWGSDRFCFDADGFRFIGLHQGPRMKMADGHFAPEDLRWIDTVLANMPTGQPFFVVTHYPVDSSIANWYELLDRVKRYNVRAILVGHGHANRGESFEGIPGAMARSTLRGSDPGGGYVIGRVYKDTLALREKRIAAASGNAWLKIPLRPQSESKGVHRWPRPDFTINDTAPNVRTVWSFRSGYLIASSAGVGGGTVVVGDASGKIFGLSLERGSVVWEFKTAGPVYSSPAVAEGAVVFGSTDSSIYCLNLRDGSLRWRCRTGAPVVASPMVSTGVVYIGGSDHTFRALELASGKRIWEYPGVHGFVECTPLLFDGRVYFGAWDGCFYALDAVHGGLVWKWGDETTNVLFSPAACCPVGASGRVFIVAPDRMMTAFDAGTGNVLWRSGIHQVRESIGLSADGRRVFVRTMRDTIVALSTSSTTPQTLWSTDAGFGYDINAAMLEEKDGVVFYGTKNGLLVALESSTGRLLWKHRAGVGAIHTVTPLDAHKVITTDFDGTVQLIEEHTSQ